MRQRRLTLPSASGPLDLDALIAIMARDHGIVLGKSDPAMAMLTGFDQVSRAVCLHIHSEMALAKEEISDIASHQITASKRVAEQLVEDAAGQIRSQIDQSIQSAAPRLASALIANLENRMRQMGTIEQSMREALTIAWVSSVGISLVALAMLMNI